MSAIPWITVELKEILLAVFILIICTGTIFAVYDPSRAESVLMATQSAYIASLITSENTDVLVNSVSDKDVRVQVGENKIKVVVDNNENTKQIREFMGKTPISVKQPSSKEYVFSS